MKNFYIRKALQKDVNEIHQIQMRSYDEKLVEDLSVFSYVVSFGNSYVAVEKTSNKLIGYILTHASKQDQIQALNTSPNLDSSVESMWDCTFIHDLCVLFQYRNIGIGTTLYKTMKANLNGIHYIRYIQLIAINPEAIVFWKKIGFVVKRNIGLIEITYSDELGYGSHSALMEHAI